MHKIFNILLAALTVLCLSQAVDIGSFQRKPNFDVLFVKDRNTYLKSNNKECRLQHLNTISVNEGCTLGKNYDSKLFDLTFNLDSFEEGALTYNESYTYPDNVTLDIQYVKLVCKNVYEAPLAYLRAGGIGKSFIALLVEVKQTKDVVCHAQVYGDIYDVIN